MVEYGDVIVGEFAADFPAEESVAAELKVADSLGRAGT